jgi:hypothetical protein
MNKALLIATTWCLSFWMARAYQQPEKEEKGPPAVHDMRLCPANQVHSHLTERGEAGMGFSQSATTHHFILQATGGIIQVEATNPEDTGDRDSIRHHLVHIAQAFGNGDFDIPMFVHDAVPAGVPDLKRLNANITYSFEQTPAGGQVVIRASDPQALSAIHKFLRYQIEEHQTGDPLILTPKN